MAGTRLIADKYEVGTVLGRGGMGEVYEATDSTTGRKVALKVMRVQNASTDTQTDDRASEETEREWEVRFEREVRAIGNLRSPHVVEVLDAGIDRVTNERYLVMERLVGEDLASLPKRLGPLPVHLALRLVAQALLGLERAHASGIVHRDIKPSNLFLTTAGVERSVRILDFGIARMGHGDEEQDLTELTRTGSMLGSPQYMSPEQARGAKNVDARADLWSMGVVLYRLLSNTLPHRSTDGIGGLLVSICTTPAPQIQTRAPWVPPEVSDIVHTALHLKREDRYPSARAMYEAIAALLPDRSCTVDESMLVPLTNEERARVAPTARVLVAASQEVENVTVGGISSRTQVMPNRPLPPRKRSWLGIGVAIAALGIALGAVGLSLRREPPVVPAVATPPIVAPKDVEVELRVPPEATVEVSGVPTEVKDGVVILQKVRT